MKKHKGIVELGIGTVLASLITLCLTGGYKLILFKWKVPKYEASRSEVIKLKDEVCEKAKQPGDITNKDFCIALQNTLLKD